MLLRAGGRKLGVAVVVAVVCPWITLMARLDFIVSFSSVFSLHAKLQSWGKSGSRRDRRSPAAIKVCRVPGLDYDFGVRGHQHLTT